MICSALRRFHETIDRPRHLMARSVLVQISDQRCWEGPSKTWRRAVRKKWRMARSLASLSDMTELCISVSRWNTRISAPMQTVSARRTTGNRHPVRGASISRTVGGRPTRSNRRLAHAPPPRRSRPLAATHCFLRRLVASCGRRLFTYGAGHSCDPRLSRPVNAMRACGLLWKPSGTVCRRRAAAQFQRPRAKAVSAIATPRGGHADVSAALMALGEASHLTEGAFGVSRFLPA